MSQLHRWSVLAVLSLVPIRYAAQTAHNSEPPQTHSASEQDGTQEDFTATITGRFIDRDGAAIADVEVVHTFWPGNSIQSRSDAEGRFAATISWSAALSSTWYVSKQGA